MKFGPVPVSEAEGSLIAHATRAGGIRLRKAHRLTAEDIAALKEAAIERVIVATLEEGDLDENAAATAIADGLVIGGISINRATTGRVNLHAATAGLFTVDASLIDAINAVDPDITLATLANHTPVEAGRMVATVKIIPFAVSGAAVQQVIRQATDRLAMQVATFDAADVALIQTQLPSVKASVLDKTTSVTRARLARSGSRIIGETRVAHEAEALAAAIGAAAPTADLVLIFGASAVSDDEDVIPAAIRLAGGRIERVGMPVDPGNLLVLGSLAGKPVIGAPGCARSPKENGFDWVLDRVLSGQPPSSAEIAGMGVGGLLMEIGSRPAPRERTEDEADKGEPNAVHAIVLAAGRSSRMGGPNKLLARFEGKPLIRHVVERALASIAASVTVVVGHQADAVRLSLDGLDTRIVENPDFASGLSSSLKTGIGALASNASGALVILGDMPAISRDDLDRLMVAFESSGRNSIVRATHGGKRGNPVILPHAAFAMLSEIEGDTGARAIVEPGRFETMDVELGAAAALDVDTPEAMVLAGGVLTA